ncbi:MAG: hypothetical protein WAN46_03305 [Gammaproteobacteria bacterium]
MNPVLDERRYSLALSLLSGAVWVEGDQVVLKVRDSSSERPKGALQNIFDLFGQADKPLERP